MAYYEYEYRADFWGTPHRILGYSSRQQVWETELAVELCQLYLICVSDVRSPHLWYPMLSVISTCYPSASLIRVDGAFGLVGDEVFVGCIMLLHIVPICWRSPVITKYLAGNLNMIALSCIWFWLIHTDFIVLLNIDISNYTQINIDINIYIHTYVRY